MSFTLTFAWWCIPAAITLVAFGWWLFVAHKDFSEGGMFAGIGALVAAAPAALVSGIAWAVAGFCK